MNRKIVDSDLDSLIRKTRFEIVKKNNTFIISTSMTTRSAAVFVLY